MGEVHPREAMSLCPQLTLLHYYFMGRADRSRSDTVLMNGGDRHTIGWLSLRGSVTFASFCEYLLFVY